VTANEPPALTANEPGAFAANVPTAGGDVTIAQTGPPPLDLGRLQAEINAEVRRRRASGDFPLGLERELDTMFARYAPAGAGDDFDEVMTQAETQSFIHADVPTASNIAPLVYVKRALRKLMAWYVRFLAQQVTAFAGAITRAVKLLGERVDTLETVTVLAGQRTVAEVRERRAGPDLAPWAELVVAELGGARGRVLHTECGAGSLVGALVACGANAYGVEPIEALALDASRAGLDVRVDDALVHLRALPDRALDGVVLSGCTDCLPLGEVLELADRAVAVLAPGGQVVVLSTGPAAWAGTLDPIVADLAPGRPLHPETWSHLLAERGIDEMRVVWGAGAEALGAVPGTVPGAEVLNANVERLNHLLFGPAAYAVLGHRR